MVDIERDTENFVLAAWLGGEHTEDIDLFRPDDFTYYSGIVGCLQRGITDIFEIAKVLEVSPKSINDIRNYRADALYESSVGALRKELAHRWISENPDASIEEIEIAMKRFEPPMANLPKAPDDPVQEMIDDFNLRQNNPFVSTGINGLDYMLNGIRRKELTSVGARPSVGKSAFCQQVALNVAKNGYKVLFFPLEMSTVALMERMFMRYANVSQAELRRGLTKKTWENPEVADALQIMDNFFEKGNLLIFERCNDLKQIRELIRLHRPYLIVIDQLEQLKDGNMRFPDKRSRFSHMTHELQGMAMDENVAIWLACQVNRGADNQRPTMANLKESGSLEEDSDNVILLHREGEKTEVQSIILELAKQRAGECGDVSLAFIARKFAFYEREY